MAYMLPRSRKIILDNGEEFKKDFRTISTDYGVKVRNTTVKNPQANDVLERVHLTICNMLRSKTLADFEMPEDDPWAAILQVQCMPCVARTIQHCKPLRHN